MTNLYNRITVFRAERGVSRRELAEAVRVNNQTTSCFSFRPFESVADTLRRAAAVRERLL